MAAVILIAALVAFVLGIYEYLNAGLEENLLTRQEAGTGDYEQELILSAEGLLEEHSYLLEVPEQIFTKEQAEKLLTRAAEELLQTFPGENPSINEIRERVVLSETYQDGRVTAEWSFDNYKILDYEGNVIAETLPEEGILVKAEAELACGEYVRVEEFYFRVLPRFMDEKESFLLLLQENLEEQGRQAGSEYLKLPEEVDGHKVTWHLPKEHLPAKVFLFGIVLAGMLPLLERSREEERRKKRNRQMEGEYPELISKLTLLLGAGMTLQGAWRKIALTYREKRKHGTVFGMPVYEEMLIACREMESGIGEERAYEHFGERCGLSCYRKLGNMLSQNLRKGSLGITALLENEVEAAFEERKNLARKYGEEATTKLLFPMILMLGMVVVVLIVPAILSFQL